MKFRFKITEENKEPFYTEWFDEPLGEAANRASTQIVTGLRGLYPKAKFKIERDSTPKMPNAEQRAEIEARWLQKEPEQSDV